MGTVRLVLAVSLIVLLTAGVLSGCHSVSTEQADQIRDCRDSLNLRSAYEEHGPITIHNDTEFSGLAVSEGWNGSGTLDAPYRIVGYEIHAQVCISIRNVDCYFVVQDCVLTSLGSGTGVHLYYAPHGRIESCVVHSAYTAIDISYSSGVQLSNNTIYWANRGVVLTESSECEITANSLSNCSLWINAWHPENWLHNVTSNYVNGRDLGYFRGLSSTFIDAQSCGQVILADCHSVDLFGGAGVGMYYGIESGIAVGYCQDCVLHDCFSYHNYYGVYIDHSNGTLLERCEMHYNQYGIVLNQSQYCNMTSCWLFGNSDAGVCVSNCVSCTLLGNTIDNNDSGIYVLTSSITRTVSNTFASNKIGAESYFSVGCVFQANSFFSNSEIGLKLGDGCSGCWVYHNQFVDNAVQAWDNGDDNTWDDGYILGNHWSDYYGSGVYQIPGTAVSVDRYPSQYTETTSVTTTIIDPTTTTTDAVTTTTMTTDWHPPPSPWSNGNLIAWIVLGLLSAIGTATYATVRSSRSATGQ